mmetsp:Transcript_21511/g.34582  ORF Transcript_21511/g.34582 Transcript_21511/m.34582 type:complete len:93 (+) Transcript_21511:350-628(+)
MGCTSVLSTNLMNSRCTPGLLPMEGNFSSCIRALQRTVGVEVASKNMCVAFFEEVNDLYTKIVLNPFYEQDQPIDSKVFDSRVRTIATKWGF